MHSKLPTSYLSYVWLLLALVAFLGACEPGSRGAGPGPEPEQTSESLLKGKLPPAYRDVDDVLTGADEQRFAEACTRLARDFADLCGDSFCGGRYTNIESVSFRCALAVASGRITTCTWVFGASSETVTGNAGLIRVDARTFACGIAIDALPGELTDLVLAPGATGAVRRPLPRARGSLYDALITCLSA